MSQRDDTFALDLPSGATPAGVRATPQTPSSMGGASHRGLPIAGGRMGTGGLPRADLREAPRRGQTPGREGGASTPSSQWHVRDTASPQSLAHDRLHAARRSSRGPTSSAGGATPLDAFDTAGDFTEADAQSPGARHAPQLPPLAALAASDAYVWGTPFNLRSMMDAFRDFIKGFQKHHELIEDRKIQRAQLQAAHNKRVADERRMKRELLLAAHGDAGADSSDSELELPADLAEERDEEIRRESGIEGRFYMELLRNKIENEPRTSTDDPINIEIDVRQLFLFNNMAQSAPELGFAGDGKFVTHLRRYPADVIPIMDLVLCDIANDIVSELGVDRSATDGLAPAAPKIRTRIKNLDKLSRGLNKMRDLNPENIDQLVCLSGMVTRTTAIIPDMRRCFFRCSNCAATVEVDVDRGRVEDPAGCEACRSRASMEIVHNRSTFIDKQQVKLQEAPENVPEGETPCTIVLYVFEEMVDFVKPGDRVVVTGIFRALARRMNPRQRTINSIFNTVIDAIHFEKGDKNKMTTSKSDSASKEYEPTLALATTADRAADVQARVEAMRKEEDDESGTKTFAALVASLAPSIWEMDDVKKGVLLQLFGGVNKDLGMEGKSAELRGCVFGIRCAPCNPRPSPPPPPFSSRRDQRALMRGPRHVEIAAALVRAPNFIAWNVHERHWLISRRTHGVHHERPREQKRIRPRERGTRPLRQGHMLHRRVRQDDGRVAVHHARGDGAADGHYCKGGYHRVAQRAYERARVCQPS